MNCNQGDTTLYDIVVVDRATGKRSKTSHPPIQGRYQAQDEADKLTRNSRNPNLSYHVERGIREKDVDISIPERLTTHKFKRYE